MRGIVPFSQMGRQDAEQNGQTWGGGKEGENCEEEREERKNERVERERGLRKGAGCGGCRSGLSAVLVWILLRAV